MYKFVVLSVILTITSATPGNLGLGYGGVISGGYSSGLGLGGYSGNQVTVAAGSVAAPVVAAVPYVTAPVAVAPVATSSQARVDLNGPTHVVTQIAAAVPVAQVRTIAAGGYGGYGGYGGAAGASGGYGGSSAGAYGVASGAAGGPGGHGY